MIPAGTPLGDTLVSLPGSPVVGQVDSEGRLLHLGRLEGWWDSPASSGQTTQKVNDHGAFLGPAFYQPRIINWESRVDGLSPADSLAVARQLIAAVPVNDLATLSVAGPEGTLTAAIRQEGDPILVRQGYRMVVSLSLIAPDPRRYSLPITASTGLPISTGGFVLPIVLPVTTGAGTSVSGVVAATNLGDLEAPVVFTISGPVPDWTITDNFGRQLAGLDAVPAGRKLTIDTGARTALLDGVANRTVTGSWPMLRPGVNEFRFNSSTYDAGATMDATYRSAWR